MPPRKRHGKSRQHDQDPVDPAVAPPAKPKGDAAPRSAAQPLAAAPSPKPAKPDASTPAPAGDDDLIDIDAVADLVGTDEPTGEPEVESPDGEEPIEGGVGPEHRQIVVRRDIHTRLDVYLHNRLKGLSRTRVQKLIDMGGVHVNARAPKASTQIKAGDTIDIILPPRAVRQILPEPIPLAVLYEDDHFIVLNKQAGVIVHPARSNLSGTLLNGLAYHFKKQVESAGGTFQAYGTRGFSKQSGVKKVTPAAPDASGGEPAAGAEADGRDGRIEGLSTVGAREFRPGIIHRLDKNTTGVIVVAKSEEAHWGIARQFEDRSTLKAYLAVVHGNLDLPGGAVEQPIGKHPTIREACAIRNDSAGKHALTLFRVREQYRGYSLVELELKTGRTHQIRVHMAYLGHPIVGDVLYGGEPVGEPEFLNPPATVVRRYIPFAQEKAKGQQIEAAAKARPDLILAHPALHATLLRFVHPIERKPMTFTAPLHEPMLGLVRRLRKQRIDGPVAREGFWVDLSKACPESDAK